MLFCSSGTNNQDYSKIDKLVCSNSIRDNINPDTECNGSIYEQLESIDGIDSYDQSSITYYYPERGKVLTLDDFVCEKYAESTKEIAEIGIRLIKYMFYLNKYDYTNRDIYSTINPYYFCVSFYDTNNVKTAINLSITESDSLELRAVTNEKFYCFGAKDNGYLYNVPGVYTCSMPEMIVKDVKDLINLAKSYLEDKPVRRFIV